MPITLRINFRERDVTADDIAHLLRRTEFFAKPARMAELGAGTTAAAVDNILDFGPNGNPQLPANLVNNDGSFDQKAEAFNWWLDSMATRPRPFQEKMALFWHGHFAVSYTHLTLPTILRV